MPKVPHPSLASRASALPPAPRPTSAPSRADEPPPSPLVPGLSSPGGSTVHDAFASASDSGAATRAAADAAPLRPAGPSKPAQLALHELPAALDAQLAGPIWQEAQAADWRGCGIDPQRYVEDRMDRGALLEPLRLDPDARIVLHRRALSVGQAPGVHPQKVELVSGENARDYPGRVYRERGGATFHLVGIPGEEWFLQTLHMLAVAGVPPEKVLVEGVPDTAGLAARELDHTLRHHTFDHVVVGTLGALTQAVERALRAEAQPAHAQRCLARMQAHLEERSASARPDRKDRWEARAAALAAIVAGGDATGAGVDAIVAAIEAEPDLKACLAEHLRDLRAGAPAEELPMKASNGKAKVFSHRILEVGGKKHLLLHIGGAHGDLAYAALREVLAQQPALRRVSFYGTCGSFDGTRLPPDTFVRPSGSLRSSVGGRPEVTLENRVQLPGAKEVRHTHVATLLEEHRAGLQTLATRGETVDIEGYHVARAVAEPQAAGRDIDFRMLLRVSDVATDAHLGAHRLDRADTSDYDGRRDTEEEVAYALGFLERAPADRSAVADGSEP